MLRPYVFQLLFQTTGWIFRDISAATCCASLSFASYSIRHAVAEKQRRAAGIHDVDDAALEVRETLIEHRHAQLAAVMRQPCELVAISSADEAESPHHVQLLGVQQMHREAARLE